MVARNILLLLLAILGVGAIFGGGVLIISPSGTLLGMPLSILEHSPFKNFLVPGIILFTILGVLPVGLIFVLINKPSYAWAKRLNIYKDMYWGWTYCIYIVFALVIWVQLEMVFLAAVHWAHTLYMFLALLILLVLLLPRIRDEYKIKIRNKTKIKTRW